MKNQKTNLIFTLLVFTSLVSVCAGQQKPPEITRSVKTVPQKCGVKETTKSESSTTARNERDFDKFYAGVPQEQVARLKQFRLNHPYKRLAIGDTKWEYIACGRASDQTLLLLPGALSVGESVFPLITAFENKYRVIAPSYALSQTMKGLTDGINSILEAEGVKQVHLIGGSYGGLVAQYFVRRFPDKVQSLILSHTFIMTQEYAKPLVMAGKFFSDLPPSQFVSLLKPRLDQMLLSTLRAAKHPEAEFWKAYLDETIASDRLRDVFIHQNKTLLDLSNQPQFAPDDLKNWRGKILIIESDDDPAISASDRKLLKTTYPQAQVHTFTDAGHASSILKREDVISIIENFLNNRRLK